MKSFRSPILNWIGIKNGELLRAAEEAGFDVLITSDFSLPATSHYQRPRHPVSAEHDGAQVGDGYALNAGLEFGKGCIGGQILLCQVSFGYLGPRNGLIHFPDSTQFAGTTSGGQRLISALRKASSSGREESRPSRHECLRHIGSE
jgi:hypothetical protein